MLSNTASTTCSLCKIWVICLVQQILSLVRYLYTPFNCCHVKNMYLQKISFSLAKKNSSVFSFVTLTNGYLDGMFNLKM